MAAMNAAFEAAMVVAGQAAKFYCVTASPDIRACSRWPKLRGATIIEGVHATSRIVDHVQMQLPTLRFHAMTADFIKDTNGVWWLTRVVDFKASSSVEPTRDEVGFGTRDSAVLIPESLRPKHGRLNNEPQMDDPESPPRESTLLRGDEFNNALNSRTCFLCGSPCELTATFRCQLEAMLKGDCGDDYKESSVTSMKARTNDEFRMTLTMALDTIFLMRQRGVGLPVWEHAVSTVRKSQVRDVCDFPTCMLCYRIYQQQNRLQLIARELHTVLSPNETCSNDQEDEENAVANSFKSDGFSTATSAASGLAAKLLSTELQYAQETPKSVLEALEAFRAEPIPPSLLLRGDSVENRPTSSILSPVRGADVDPTATQLRFVFFFHELQDGGPDLEPTDFFLEYQLGQNITRVHLEGSKRHTPNRWQLCEARIHYLCATLDAFNEFCTQKRLLIKMKAKPRYPIDAPEGDPNRYRDKEEFFGYASLPLRTVNTSAKWFGNSLQPESRTDYLLDLHTASFGLLTLKLTVGLLVDPVPLGHVRDVLREFIFLEEQQPRGVYWPPISHCHGGLAVPRDWVGALMPSEYTKILPMRRRDLPEYHRSQSLRLTMDGTTLSGVCMIAKRIVFRITEDAATKNFPTLLLAVILRYAFFVSLLPSVTSWKSPAIFQFTRKYSVDRLLAEVKPDTIPILSFLGELLQVLLEDHAIPASLDASTLERVLKPFWQQESGWCSIPRTRTGCLPERRVIWNRAIRRWVSATGSTTAIDEIREPTNEIREPTSHDENGEIMIPRHGLTLNTIIGEFRSKALALVLCELFEKMETLDNEYIEIAELRSLAKCLPNEAHSCVEERLDPDMGTRERLTQDDIVVLSDLVGQQRRLTLRTLLLSLMGSAVMLDALARFDRVGSGEMSLEGV
ncbi:hypothetical protein PHMEG_00013832 [Phytophthora megakarya]|uniref:Uncharacterized protein n=1 Tax=Phytophthora megakarya TaxID=4795 RepID=A0A225W5S0_9STRA|nr:hypothetical protein PHMEG_00013832 [Phytophthora megakarya]